MVQQESDENQPYYGDLEKTLILSRLFQVPGEQRDENWQKTFLDNVADASFTCGNPQVIQGPDGFLYFELNIPAPGIEFQCFVIRHLSEDFLLEHGLGIVIHPSKSPPEWVFSYGDIANFHLRNEFYTETDAPPMPANEIITEEEKVLVAQPSEYYLPQKTRDVLRNFLKYHGLENVRIMLIQRHKPGGIIEELVFNLTREKFDTQERYEAVMRGIGWFLPRHYTYVSMAEGDLANSFDAL